jgi:hypothetical protein
VSSVLVNCSHCEATSDVPADGVLLDLQAAALSWICLECGELDEQDVPQHMLQRLIDVGASLITSDVGSLPPHPESPPSGAPLTHDDLLDLHELLAQPSWLIQLGAPGSETGQTRHLQHVHQPTTEA